jgi:polar amino acid transport system substrate-binding protein/cystine transport system substrate-binding protein/membrane-bound lytic murein transglycosylase F
MKRMYRIAVDLGGLSLIVVLLLLVGLVPPDTSLLEMRKTGALKVCVPITYPPLVTGDPTQPGIDIEILLAISNYIGVEMLLSHNDAIGRDFNPLNWGITRGDCQVLAGGFVDTSLTRSFLDIGPPYAETGWAIVAPAPIEYIGGLTIGVLTNIYGLDRIELSRYLRSHDVIVRIMRNSQELVDGIASGELDVGVTEALLAGKLAADKDWWAAFLPDELVRYNLVFGLWKGDLTLKRKIVQALRQVESDGTLVAILERYVQLPKELTNLK